MYRRLLYEMYVGRHLNVITICETRGIVPFSAYRRFVRDIDGSMTFCVPFLALLYRRHGKACIMRRLLPQGYHS